MGISEGTLVFCKKEPRREVWHSVRRSQDLRVTIEEFTEIIILETSDLDVKMHIKHADKVRTFLQEGLDVVIFD